MASEYLKLFNGEPVHLDKVKEENPMLEITLEMMSKLGAADKKITEQGVIFEANGKPNSKLNGKH